MVDGCWWTNSAWAPEMATKYAVISAYVNLLYVNLLVGQIFSTVSSSNTTWCDSFFFANRRPDWLTLPCWFWPPSSSAKPESHGNHLETQNICNRCSDMFQLIKSIRLWFRLNPCWIMLISRTLNDLKLETLEAGHSKSCRRRCHRPKEEMGPHTTSPSTSAALDIVSAHLGMFRSEVIHGKSNCKSHGKTAEGFHTGPKHDTQNTVISSHRGCL